MSVIPFQESFLICIVVTQTRNQICIPHANCLKKHYGQFEPSSVLAYTFLMCLYQHKMYVKLLYCV